MEFASKYVLGRRAGRRARRRDDEPPAATSDNEEEASYSSDESVYDGELDEGWAASAFGAAPAPQLAAAPERPAGGGRNKQAVGTNVICVKCATLGEEAQIHTGDIVLCKECGVALNSRSAVAEPEPGVLVWTCEFCGVEQPLDICREELPGAQSVDFILEAPPVVEADDNSANIVFCVDVSGSMCVTTEVPGRNLAGLDRSAAARRMNAEFGDGSAQFLPGQRRDVSYMSRLQSMQQAVAQQIAGLKQSSPDRRVGLVTFGDDVRIVGDGRAEPTVIAGAKLDSYDAVLAEAQQCDALSHPVSETAEALDTKVKALEEGGQTALGPALVASVAIAAARPGGVVVLCTDGLANVGIGSLEDLDAANEEACARADKFYGDIAEYAKSKGVTVSIVSITGTECKLEHLGHVADVTGGEVERVDPLQLASNFQSLLSRAVIATNVSVQMILHHGFEFRDVTDARLKELGSVTADTEVLYEFRASRKAPEVAVQDGSEAAEAAPAAEDAAPAAAPAAAAAAAPAAPTELPFQVKIYFTKLDGTKCLRTITEFRPVTSDRAEAEREMNVAVCAANAAQKSAQLAQSGRYKEARVTSYAWRKMMSRNASAPTSSAAQRQQLTNYCTEMGDFDTSVQQAVQSEATDLDSLLSRGEALEEVSHRRRMARTDTQARHFYKNKKAASSRFQ